MSTSTRLNGFTNRIETSRRIDKDLEKRGMEPL